MSPIIRVWASGGIGRRKGFNKEENIIKWPDVGIGIQNGFKNRCPLDIRVRIPFGPPHITLFVNRVFLKYNKKGGRHDWQMG